MLPATLSPGFFSLSFSSFYAGFSGNFFLKISHFVVIHPLPEVIHIQVILYLHRNEALATALFTTAGKNEKLFTNA